MAAAPGKIYWIFSEHFTNFYLNARFSKKHFGSRYMSFYENALFYICLICFPVLSPLSSQGISE